MVDCLSVCLIASLFELYVVRSLVCLAVCWREFVCLLECLFACLFVRVAVCLVVCLSGRSCAASFARSFAVLCVCLRVCLRLSWFVCFGMISCLLWLVVVSVSLFV